MAGVQRVWEKWPRMKQVNYQEPDPIYVRNDLPISMNKAGHNFDRDYVESITYFGKHVLSS